MDRWTCEKENKFIPVFRNINLPYLFDLIQQIMRLACKLDWSETNTETETELKTVNENAGEF